MPRGDGTGPLGQGPMTGRGMGFCAGYNSPGYINPGFGRGYFGGGRGRGYRNWYRATGLPGWWRANIDWPAWGGYQPPQPYQPTQDQEKEMLSQQLKALKEQTQAIEERLQELKGSKK